MPLFVPLLAFAAGIAVAAMGVSVGAAAWTAAAGIILIAARYRRLAGVALLFIACGLTDARVQGPVCTDEVSRSPATFCGTVSRVGRSARGGISVTLRELSGGRQWQGWQPRRRGGVRVSLPAGNQQLREGDRVAVTAPCTAVNPDGDSFDRYLAATGVGYTARADAADVVILRSGGGFAANMRRVAFAAGDALEGSQLDERTSGFLRALLLGDRTALDPDLRNDFAGAGLAHVLAVSGLHVGIIMAILGAALLPLGRLGRGRVRQALLIAGVWVFAIMAGLSPSVVRAAVMATFLLLAAILQRYNSSLNALCGAGLLILAADPTALADPGFQLSFLCVAGILSYSHAMRGLDTARTHRLLRMAGAAAAGVCALLLTWPLTLRMFGEVAPMGIVASLIVLPLLPAYMGLGLLFTVLATFGAAPDWMARLLDAGLDGGVWLARWISGDGARVIRGSADAIVCALWVAGMIFLCASIVRRRVSAGIAGGVLACAAVAWLWVVAPERAGCIGIAGSLRGSTLNYIPAGGGAAQRMEVPGRGATMLRAGGVRILSLGAESEAGHARGIACDVLLIGSGFVGWIEEAAAECGAARVVVCRRGIAGAVDAEAALRRAGVDVHIIALDGPFSLDSDE